jgi:hypothetical protein
MGHHLSVGVQKGKELNDFQRNPLDIEILSNLRFGSLEIRDTSVTIVTNKYIPVCQRMQRKAEKNMYEMRLIITCQPRLPFLLLV